MPEALRERRPQTILAAAVLLVAAVALVWVYIRPARVVLIEFAAAVVVGGGVYALSRSSAAPAPDGVRPVRLRDVAFSRPASRDVRALVDLIRRPRPFRRLRVTPPRAALLQADPGTDTHALARAVARETGRRVVTIDAAAPALVVIDHLDALARAAADSPLVGLLVQELDLAADRREAVFALGVAAEPGQVPPALRARFPVVVTLGAPDLEARTAVLRRCWPRQCTATPEAVAQVTPGFSDRALHVLVQAAAAAAVAEQAPAVTEAHFLAALSQLRPGDLEVQAARARRDKLRALMTGGG